MSDSCHIFTNSEFIKSEVVTFWILHLLYLESDFFLQYIPKSHFENWFNNVNALHFKNRFYNFSDRICLKKNVTAQTWHLYFVRESIFVYENHITQIDSISLVHAMVPHIKNSFDHFSDDLFLQRNWHNSNIASCIL